MYHTVIKGEKQTCLHCRCLDACHLTKGYIDNQNIYSSIPVIVIFKTASKTTRQAITEYRWFVISLPLADGFSKGIFSILGIQ